MANSARESVSARESAPETGRPAMSDFVPTKEKTALQHVFSSQPFWVTIALLIIIILMSFLQPDAFATKNNFYNITRAVPLMPALTIE